MSLRSLCFGKRRSGEVGKVYVSAELSGISQMKHERVHGS